MALNASVNWRIRIGGNELNGGGYDSAVSGAGTDYSEQDSPQLSLTDLATTGVTATITSVAAGFTAAMVGNIVRIASGTNFTAGYYMIITYTNATTVILDRAPTTGAGVSGVGRIGGAHASFINYTNGGSGLSSPAIATPLAAGHTVNWRGNGTSDPSGTVTWDYSAGYWTAPDGSTTSGIIKITGYNGRPFVGTSPLLINAASNWRWDSISFKFLASTNVDNGISGKDDNLNNCHYNHYIDGNGKDVTAIDTTGVVVNCRLISSGAAATYPALKTNTYGGGFIGNTIKNWRGSGIKFYSTALGACALNNIINGCKVGGISISDNSSSPGSYIIGNTIYNCTGDGVLIPSSATQNIASLTFFNNIISTCSGYGFNSPSGSTALNDRLKHHFFNYNNLYNNTSGAYNNLSLSSNDTTLDPQFTNASGDDFTVGANMKAIGFPGALPLGGTAYVDKGAIQRVEPSSTNTVLIVNKRSGASLAR